MRKNNFRIVQINGFRGLLLTLFIMSCLIAGFIAFPSFLTMNLWNYFAAKTNSSLFINFYESVLLWGIIAFSAFIFNKRKFIVSFSAQQELTESEVKKVVSKIREINKGNYKDNLKHEEAKEKEEVKSE